MSTQADPDLARLIREKFVLVAGDRWYHSRRSDDEGRFILELDEQAQLLNPSNKRIQQGLYCFSADGQLLTHCNRNARFNRKSLKDALVEWDKLPAAKRRPGSITVVDKGRPDARYNRRPPTGGLILNVFMRILDNQDDGYRVGTTSFPGGAYAGRDRMWITKYEWQALVPADAAENDEVAIPATLRQRILRYHLCDHTRGHAHAWYPEHIRESEMKLTVTSATDSRLRLALRGNALIAASGQPVEKSPRGYDVAFLGHIDFDRPANRMTRFDFVAIGDHWGETRFNQGARKGRTPLGIAYELCPDDDVGRHVPPVGMTDVRGYMGRN